MILDNRAKRLGTMNMKFDGSFLMGKHNDKQLERELQ